jgi:hypothetical protein
MNTPFRVKLSLATAITLNAPLTLDALLSAAVANATGLEGDDTLPHIPLAQSDGIFRGSALFMHPRFRHEVVGRVMALRGERDLSIHAFRPNGRQYVNVHTDKAKKYANKLSSYPGYRTNEVYFYGVGDAERVVYLLANFLPGIGKRATTGAGEITAASWTETDEDYSWQLPNGSPARPLPRELWLRIGGDASLTSMPLAVTLPYWKTNKVDSVFPATFAI